MTNYPIDFVLLWVDGSDPQWLAEKNRWLVQAGKDPINLDAGANRYRDWDNLRYWFRAVETYAPWVNRVHFVTCGQKPEWLNPDAPKLHLVNHRDFIPQEFLPTFSSHPIELNLHRIPGLADHFVYFNDDMFVAGPTDPKDFFVKGLPCNAISEEPYEFTDKEIFNDILINNIICINRHFSRKEARRQHPDKWYNLRCPHETAKNLLMSGLGNRKFFGLAYGHLSQSYLKSTLETVWREENQLLTETCSHRFRDSRDVSQSVFDFWQQLSGTIYPTSRRKTGRVFSAAWDPREAADAIRQKRYKLICLNDSCTMDFEATKATVNAAFAQALPNKSSFEL